ncbi:DUF6228 family protein [Arthrobacter sp. B2I5]|uniref:DUF6228 family protein n=1 Tax=Arthrobacter sp. B2I5 TaxID=3042266 RepID=UPI0027D778F5|nr:DUF6228 family protein [Arthrobacter sp. B2I5]
MKRPLRIVLVFLFIVVAFTLITLARPLLSGEDVGLDRVLSALAVGVVVAAAAYGIVRWQQARENKKPQGFPTVTRFRAALSKGRLPAGAAPDLWQRELTKTIRVEKPFIWAGPLIFGAFAVLGAVLAVSNLDHPWFWVICTCLFLGLAIWAPISVIHRRRTMESLISELADSPPQRAVILDTFPGRLVLMGTMDRVEVGQPPERLIFTQVQRGTDGIPFNMVVAVELGALTAGREVASHYATGFDDLALFFADLAETWRGWNGTRNYESMERDFLLEATHTGSHVELHFTLQDPESSSAWSLRGKLTLDAGEELSRASGDVQDLLRHGPAKTP